MMRAVTPISAAGLLIGSAASAARAVGGRASGISRTTAGAGSASEAGFVGCALSGVSSSSLGLSSAEGVASDLTSASLVLRGGSEAGASMILEGEAFAPPASFSTPKDGAAWEASSSERARAERLTLPSSAPSIKGLDSPSTTSPSDNNGEGWSLACASLYDRLRASRRTPSHTTRGTVLACAIIKVAWSTPCEGSCTCFAASPSPNERLLASRPQTDDFRGDRFVCVIMKESCPTDDDVWTGAGGSTSRTMRRPARWFLSWRHLARALVVERSRQRHQIKLDHKERT